VLYSDVSATVHIPIPGKKYYVFFALWSKKYMTKLPGDLKRLMFDGHELYRTVIS